eukprot:scaffold91106_cov72-Phaeocystis_antarctica.AAC.1
MRSRSHELPNPESRVRGAKKTTPKSESPESRVRGAKKNTPKSEQSPESRVQGESPESRVRRASQGPSKGGAIPQIPESSLRRRARASTKGRAGTQDQGSGLSVEGVARGRVQRGREREPGLRGSLVLMKTPRKQALSVRPERRISHHSREDRTSRVKYVIPRLNALNVYARNIRNGTVYQRI